jgi:hypothetical protein
MLVLLQLQHSAHVVFDIELAKNRCFLRQVPQPQARTAVNGLVFDGLAIERDAAAIGPHQTHNHVERGGFPCTVGAQQTHHFALVDSQRHIFDNLAAAVRLAQVRGLQPGNRLASRIKLGVVGHRCGHRHAHLLTPSSCTLGRRSALSGAGTGVPLPSAGLGVGVNIARTRPDGLAAVRLAGPPSTEKVSALLL